MNDHNITITEAGRDELAVVQSLAHQVWPATYGPLMSAEKLDYMLKLIYSLPALEEQLLINAHTFIIARDGQTPIGFAAYGPVGDTNKFKLYKLYVLPGIQGKGLGSMLINAVINRVRLRHASSLLLNVKKDNPAKAFYEKMGFSVVAEEDIDIGQGYFMNDFVMEKTW